MKTKQTSNAANKVKRLLQVERDKTEVFICRLKLVVILFLLIIYWFSPKGYTGEISYNLTLFITLIYIPLLVIQVWLAQKQLLRDVSVTIFTTIDFLALGALIFSFHLQYEQPAFFYLKSPTFVYFFLFITIHSLRNESRYVIYSGILSVLVWLTLFGYALSQNSDRITHDFVEYVYSGSILIGAELDKLIILALFTVVLARGVKRSHDVRLQSVDYYVRTEEQTKRKNLQLHFEKEKAEQANIAKSRFLDIISHELKTPLNGILGMTQLLLLNDRDNNELKNIMAKGELLLSHVSRILRFSEISMQTEAHMESIDDIRTLLEETLAFYKNSQLDPVNQYTCALNEALSARLDKNKTTDILYELISNADKNSRGTEIILDAVIESVDDENSNLILSVKDSGDGMSQEQLQMAMDLFSQTQDPKTRDEGGIGLGLPLANQLATSMDASLTIESEPGKGTTVTLKIPQT